LGQGRLSAQAIPIAFYPSCSTSAGVIFQGKYSCIISFCFALYHGEATVEIDVLARKTGKDKTKNSE